MRRRGVALSTRHRALIHGTTAILLGTGAIWCVLGDGEGGGDPHPWRPWLMRAHGAAAMAFLALLGTLAAVHVRLGWRMGRNRGSGALLAGACVLLAASGYLLYYAGGEGLRAGSAALHTWLGLALPLLLLGHILLGRAGSGRRGVRSGGETRAGDC